MKLPFTRPKIGLALSGGGPKGIAHIGVLKVLQKHNIQIDYIAGTSAGSIAGAFYAYTKNASQMEKFILNKNWLQLLSILVDPTYKLGISKVRQLTTFLHDYFKKNPDFKDLQIPFTAVCVDLDKAEVITYDKGELIPAILASCGAPILYSPVKHDRKTLVDGGLMTPIPVDIVKKMGADIVIAVDLYNLPKLSDQELEKMGILGFAQRSLDISLRQLALHDLERADIIVNPALEKLDWGELLKKDKRVQAIKEGELAMEKNMLSLKNTQKKSSIKSFFHKITKLWH